MLRKFSFKNLLKLKVLGMNAAFGLRSTVQLGRNVLMGVTTATAVHLPALPPPGALRINRSIAVKDEEDRREDFRRLVMQAEPTSGGGGKGGGAAGGGGK